ncbi:MAG: DsbA family oxidoreductase [Actinomycetota bacterium]|nr:DsbA family oxidoreductase [Actinomycetota bacterium]
MRVDIWSDIVCPWCYIGKREFEQGLAGFAHRDEIEVVYHAFELDPSTPPGPGQPVLGMLSAKYGLGPAQAAQAEAGVAARAAAVGLAYSSGRLTGNSFDAHRLVALGQDRGRQGEVLQRLYEAYFGEGRPVFDAADLAALGESAGLDPAEVSRTLADGEYAEDVRADEQRAGSLGISSVPFFVLDGRFGVSGAQPAATFTAVLDKAWAQRGAAAS